MCSLEPWTVHGPSAWCSCWTWMQPNQSRSPRARRLSSYWLRCPLRLWRGCSILRVDRSSIRHSSPRRQSHPCAPVDPGITLAAGDAHRPSTRFASTMTAPSREAWHPPGNLTRCIPPLHPDVQSALPVCSTTVACSLSAPGHRRTVCSCPTRVETARPAHQLATSRELCRNRWARDHLSVPAVTASVSTRVDSTRAASLPSWPPR